MGEWRVVPETEMSSMLDAIAAGRCCVCYGPIKPEHGGLYCCAHDDGCSHDEAAP